MQTYPGVLPMRLADMKLGVLVGVLLAAAILITNVLVPVMIGHATADTELTESLGWIVVICLIGGIGFMRVRWTSSVRESSLAGGIVSFVGFGIAMATFLLIDNVFLGIVSQQPEKIWLFKHSGYPDMRTYLNHANLRAFWTVLPVISLLGAICGAVGGFLNLLVRRTTN